MVLLTGSAWAADGAASLKTEFDAAFSRMLREPSNLDVIFDFARLAAQREDYEQAIGAYERMLIYNPNLPTVRFELGRLYYLLGSHAFADSYFQAVEAAPDVPPAIREQVARYRAEIARRQSPHQLRGSVSGGFKYQSNANAAPGNIRVFGVPGTLDPAFRRQHDGNVFVSGEAAHTYDFQWQSGITLESTAALYWAQQFTVDRFSLAAIELQPGIRVPLLTDPALPSLSVRPYLIGGFVALAYDPFYEAGGFGLNLRSVPLRDLQTNLDLEFRHRSFTNTTPNPMLSLKDGNLKLIRLFTTYLVTPADIVGLTLQYSRNSAEVGWESYHEYSANLSYVRLFADPLGWLGGDWVASLQGGAALRPYDTPDPLVDPGATRYDHDWQLGGGLNVPLTDGLTGQLQVQQSWVRSSLPNFRYENTTVLVGIRFNF
jgi:hypothetical protein